MAAELKGEYPDAELQLLQSSGGRFEVTVDDALVYSKAATGRHAEPGEILRKVRELRAK